jgi:hypothetical protein
MHFYPKEGRDNRIQTQILKKSQNNVTTEQKFGLPDVDDVDSNNGEEELVRQPSDFGMDLDFVPS